MLVLLLYMLVFLLYMFELLLYMLVLLLYMLVLILYLLVLFLYMLVLLLYMFVFLLYMFELLLYMLVVLFNMLARIPHMLVLQLCESNLTSVPHVLLLVRRRSASQTHFDVHVALVQYTSQTLFIDFRCSDSTGSRIVRLYSKYRKNNLPDLKLLFDIFQRYS